MAGIENSSKLAQGFKMRKQWQIRSDGKREVLKEVERKLGGKKRLRNRIIVIKLLMRRRYFSPDFKHTLSCFHQKDHRGKLRMVGSTSKLFPSSTFHEDVEDKIGCYTFHPNKQIGSGYSSKVYKARKVGEDRDYAVKVIELKKYSNSNLEMLLNQIKILKALDHPNILRCYDVYRLANKCYIVTEYCEHGDLLAQLSKKGKLTEASALEIIDSIVAGVKYLMGKNIIHRDLKPANILKSSSGWKIADFGFAVQSSGQLKSSYNVGTPLYMPLEALISNFYSWKSDIFAVGVMLYELLVGRTPWESRTERDLIGKMRDVPFKIPAKQSISEKVQCLLRKMCEINYAMRMGKQEFLKLNVAGLEETENPESVMNSQEIQKIVAKRRAPKQMDSNDGEKMSENKNNHILINQLHYCRFLYYLVRNGNCILLEKGSTQKLSLLIYKHLLKLVKQLADSTSNCLNLPNWTNFNSSKKYLNTYLTIKEYASRYEKEYLLFLRNLDVTVIREINQQFLQFSNLSCFSAKFYEKLLSFLAPLLRSINHNLGVKLEGSEGSGEQWGQVEALKNLVKYYELIEMSKDRHEDYEYFERHSSIKVHVDFRKVKNSVGEYQMVREKIKNI